MANEISGSSIMENNPRIRPKLSECSYNPLRNKKCKHFNVVSCTCEVLSRLRNERRKSTLIQMIKNKLHKESTIVIFELALSSVHAKAGYVVLYFITSFNWLTNPFQRKKSSNEFHKLHMIDNFKRNTLSFKGILTTALRKCSPHQKII